MNIPIMSIVIPSYNATPYIGDLLDGFESQSFSNWEVIIVDDGSTDDTVNVVNCYTQKDSRIKLYCRDRLPKGAQTCRNIGISKAIGRYVAIIDADDFVSPFFVEQRVNFMLDHPDVDYATFKGQTVTIGPDGEKHLGKMWGIKPKGDILSCFLQANYPFGVWNNTYKIDVAKSLHFDEKVKVYQDFDFIVGTILKGYKHCFADTSDADYFYRQGHTGRITSSFISDEKFESTKYLFKKTMNLLKGKENYQEYKRCFFRFYLLQYERVLIDGTYAQCDDFRRFINEEYGFPMSIKINLSWRFLKKSKNSNKGQISKMVYFVIYLLFSPLELLRWFARKIHVVK